MRYRIFALALLAPATLALALGCGKKDQVAGPTGGGPQPSGSGPGSAASGPKTPVEFKGEASIKGKFVFDGDMAAIKDDGSLLKQMEGNKDKEHCTAAGADTAAFTWRVNPENKGVENVVIWVEPPDGKYFKPGTPNEDVWKKKDLVIHQPNCAFIPHVSAAFVSYYDGKEIKRTDQKIKVANDAKMPHNTKWNGHDVRIPGANPTLQPGSEEELTVQGQAWPVVRADTKVPISLACSIHTWMRGTIWPLDTPYFVVSDKDGNFEIKGLPAGSDVYVVKWHESGGGRFLDGGAKGTKVTLKPDENDLGEIKIKEK
jgi:hypothetical protein